jgi:hypothetical protein
MTAVALMISPVYRGWDVVTTNGQTLAHFTGIGARWRAERFLKQFLSI